jgi:phage repressor protein C with HTH and peptisase S24 domain
MQRMFNNECLAIPTISAMHSTAERLYKAAKELRDVDGQSAVARLLNESPQTVRNWEIRGVSRQGALKAQLVIGCDAYWLLGGDGNMRAAAQGTALSTNEPSTLYRYALAPGKIHVVPVVGQGAAGDLPERIWTDGDFPVGLTHDYAEVASTDPHAFIVRVVGTSMIPRFNPGEYALVEPGTDPDIEDDVLVRLSNGQTMIKRLLSRRGGHIRLGSYNDPTVLTYERDEVTWLYYVPYPVPARKIKSRT